MLTLNGLTILGFEVIGTDPTDLRGSLWLEASSGLAFLYGQNGVGKSHVISGIRSALNGSRDSDEPVIGRIYARFNLTDPPRIVQEIIDSETAFGRNNLSSREGSWSEISDEFGRTADFLGIEMPSLLRDGWDSSRGPIVLPTTWREVVAFRVIVSFLESGWDSVLNTGAARVSIQEVVSRIVETDTICISPADGKWGIAPAVDVRDPNSAASRLLAQTHDVVRQYAGELGLLSPEVDYSELGAISSFGGLLADLGPADMASGLLMDSDALPPILLGIANSTPYAPCCISHHDWFLTDTAPIDFLDLNQCPPVNEHLNKLITDAPSLNLEGLVTGLVSFQKDGLITLGIDADESDESGETQDDGSEFDADELVDDPDEEFGQDLIVMMALREAKGLLEAIRTSANLLESCQVGLGEPEVSFVDSVNSWASGEFLSLSYEDLRAGGRRIPYVLLSDAQRRLVDMLTSIEFTLAKMHADHQGQRSAISSEPLFVIGDEVDLNLHRSAVAHFYSALVMRPLAGFLATHAFEALTLPIGQRLNLSRGISGEMVAQIFSADDLQTAAAKLGVPKEALLGLTRLFILVEGEHDRIVLETLLRTELGPFVSSLEVRVLPMRGAKEAFRIIDASIFDYSDARFLFVFDNIRADILRSRLGLGINALESGRRPETAKKEVLRSLRSDDTFEEKTASELIAHAVLRGSPQRLRVAGFPASDIIECLEPTAFGLSYSWMELHEQHKEWRHGRPRDGSDFKTFLREVHSVRVTKSLEKAMEELVITPSMLVDVLSEIRTLLQSPFSN